MFRKQDSIACSWLGLKPRKPTTLYLQLIQTTHQKIKEIKNRVYHKCKRTSLWGKPKSDKKPSYLLVNPQVAWTWKGLLAVLAPVQACFADADGEGQLILCQMKWQRRAQALVSTRPREGGTGVGATPLSFVLQGGPRRRGFCKHDQNMKAGRRHACKGPFTLRLICHQTGSWEGKYKALQVRGMSSNEGQ